MTPLEACTETRQGPVPWLTSFGDLLTLLLGFFILCIRLSPVGMKANAQSAQPVITPSPQELVAPADHPKVPGTSVAHRIGQGRADFMSWRNIEFKEQELDEQSRIIEAVLTGRPKEVVGTQDTRVSINVCLPEADLTSSTKWALARDRAQGLAATVRQLMGDDQLLRVAVTPSCSSEEGIAQIDFEQRVKVNG